MTPPSPEPWRRCRILVLGDAMLDRYWFGQVERISPEAPVPVLQVSREEDRPGGAANVALNIGQLGAQASLLCRVGDDAPAHTLHHLLMAQGVHSLLQRDPRLSTIVKLRLIGRSQQLLRADFEHPPQDPGDGLLAAFDAALSEHQAVLISDYGKGTLGDTAGLIARARAAGKPVLIDPKGRDYSAYAGATVLTPNRAELAQVVGHWADEADLQRRVEALREQLQLEAILLTRSEEGMTLYPRHGPVLHQNALAREVFDVTGAGDTVIATLAVLLASGCTLAEAVPWANRAAGLVVGKFGTASVSHTELLQGAP